MSLDSVWSSAVALKASDIHIVPGHPLIFRVDGELLPQSQELLKASDIADFMKTFLTEGQMKRFFADSDLDTSHRITDGSRFRINCHVVGGEPALTARVIPLTIPTPEDIALPPIVLDLCRSRDGLILFTGPTGSGKSTALASILSRLSQEDGLNIITLEDPIEFQLSRGKGIIRQRELGVDFPSFPEGLKHVLRQDPDVVMIGEMRDLDSISLALTLAETGHLVLGTLHTPNTAQTIDRIVDVFPSHQQSQVRMQLSLSLKAVIGQRLLPKIGGGRIANREILIKTPAVANIIRDQRLAELPSVLQTGVSEGMITFEKDLQRLKEEGVVG